MRYEVFNPRDGFPVYVTRFRFVAAILAKLARLDWAEQGQGW